MSKKDYELLAKTLGRGVFRGTVKWAFVEDLADELEKDNPRFDPDRFAEAVHDHADPQEQ